MDTPTLLMQVTVIDPAAAGTNLRGWLILLIGVALLACSLIALVVGALRGNSGRVLRIVIAALFALIPGALALTLGWQAVGEDVISIFGGSTTPAP